MEMFSLGGREEAGCLKKVAQQFLLMWSCFGTRVIRDMTLHSAPSFGSFHLIHLMFDDYVLYLLESLHCQERANDLMRAMKGEGSTAEREEEFTLTETTATSPSPGSYSPARSVHSVGVSSASSPTAAVSPSTPESPQPPQSYTWSLTYTVTTAGGSAPEAGQQLSCMRSSAPVPPPSSTHRMPVYTHREEHGYTGSYNYGSYANQHPHSIQSQYPSLAHEPAIPAPLHYSAYHRSSAQYQLNGQMSRMEPCLMGSTPRLHPAPVAPGGQMYHRLTAVTPAHLCIHPAMPPPGTCTLPWAHAGTQNTNTRSISPALPTSMERPPQAGLNSLFKKLMWKAMFKLQACQTGGCKVLKHFQSSMSNKEEQRVESTNARY
ncbi:hypothetical protein INR49_021570 [Caranx melampygus]|nr:hypothetical protein INR49_021570 [Caranx melampygus]